MDIPAKRDFIKISECGEYGLLANTELWKIAGGHSYMAGYVMDDENIEIAVTNAKEDARIMWAEARADFGF
jgi:NADH pyrophosphatase NudC (nudix superfamily)